MLTNIQLIPMKKGGFHLYFQNSLDGQDLSFEITEQGIQQIEWEFDSDDDFEGEKIETPIENIMTVLSMINEQSEKSYRNFEEKQEKKDKK